MKETNLNKFIMLVGVPIIATASGFGFFWYYELMNGKVWLSIFAGLLASSFVTMALIGMEVKK